jgi:hypothetical protein
MKYEVIFYDYSDDEKIVEQKFDTYADAEKWANNLEYDYQDIEIDENGNDYWKTFYRYYNPEDNETYLSYSVRECST